VRPCWITGDPTLILTTGRHFALSATQTWRGPKKIPSERIFLAVLRPFGQDANEVSSARSTKPVKSGGQMSHFSCDEWFGFERGTVVSPAKDFMQSHLDTGCEQCWISAEIWRNALEMCQSEASFYPPPRAIQLALSLAQPWWEPSRTTIEFSRLVFDIQPLPPRTRGSTASGRHLLYETGLFTVDLRMVQNYPMRGRICLTGQVLNSNEPARLLDKVQASLLRGYRLVTEAMGNAYGEFDLEYDREEGLKLLVDLQENGAIGIKLPD
jgi:hypothetical protein